MAKAKGINRPPAAVSLAYVHDVECAFSWHESVMGLVEYDMTHHARIIRGGRLAVRYGTGGIELARNTAVKAFMKRDAEWLFWIDTDMGFAPDTVERLLEVADKDERPVVGGLCFANREIQSDGFGGFVTRPLPTIYFAREHQGRVGFQAAEDFPRNDVVKCSGTGSACVLVHRSAFEKVADKYGETWYDTIRDSALGVGKPISEDLAFCVRLAGVDIPVHVHTGVLTTHLKPVWLGLTHHEFHRAVVAG